MLITNINIILLVCDLNFHIKLLYSLILQGPVEKMKLALFHLFEKIKKIFILSLSLNDQSIEFER